jgi:hypothetical protein
VKIGTESHQCMEAFMVASISSCGLRDFRVFFRPFSLDCHAWIVKDRYGEPERGE